MISHRIIACNRLTILVLGLLVCTSAAEEIVLKNGTSINADRVLEQGNEVVYQLGSTSYNIPRSSVVRIIRGQASGVTFTAPSSMKITVETPKPGTSLPSLTCALKPSSKKM